MKKLQPKLGEGKFYHVFTRGNNSQRTFFNEGNYEFFLRRYCKYLPDYVETYAYCLLPNHYHFLVRVKEKEAGHPSHPDENLLKTLLSAESHHPDENLLKTLLSAESHHPDANLLKTLLSAESLRAKDLHLSHLPPDSASYAFHGFNTSYAKAINKQQKRHGSLFENPFKRKVVDSEEYLIELILYIHTNPQYHGFVKDFKPYKWSSYNGILNGNSMLLKSETVMEWFDNKDNYVHCHQKKIDFGNISGFTLE